MARYDVALGTDDDLLIVNGDFAIKQSDEQHIQDTINAFPSWWKMNPLDGVGIRAWQYSPANAQAMAKSIRLNLSADGYICSPTVTLDVAGKLVVNTNAEI